MHSDEAHFIVISETIDFEVTLHFSVGTHRDSNQPPSHVAFVGGFIPGRMWDVACCKWGLACTHGGLWYPLREDARFEARVHPRHLQLFTATPHFPARVLCSMFHSQEHPHTPGGSGLGSHVVRRTTGFTPLRRQWGLWDPERHRTSGPGGRGAGLAFGPIFGSDPNHHQFPLHATAYCAARTTSNFAGVDCRPRAGRAYARGYVKRVVSGVGLVLYVGPICESSTSIGLSM